MQTAVMMGWSPGDFWRATYHDFTSALWAHKTMNEARERAAKGGGAQRELTADEVAGRFRGLSRRTA